MIPAHAKRVFKGEILEVYTWDQELFDGSHSTFERIKKVDGVVIIATTNKNKILVVKNEQPTNRTFVGLIGGMVNHGERPIDAAKRELLEETGYSSEDWELLKIYHPSSNTMVYSTYLLVARNCLKVGGQNLDPGEKIKVFKVTFDGFKKILERNAVKQGYIALELYYITKIKKLSEALKKKIFLKAKTNPLKVDEFTLPKSDESIFQPAD